MTYKNTARNRPDSAKEKIIQPESPPLCNRGDLAVFLFRTDRIQTQRSKNNKPTPTNQRRKIRDHLRINLSEKIKKRRRSRNDRTDTIKEALNLCIVNAIDHALMNRTQNAPQITEDNARAVMKGNDEYEDARF